MPPTLQHKLVTMVSIWMMNELIQVAKADGESVSHHVRQAIREYMETRTALALAPDNLTEGC